MSEPHRLALIDGDLRRRAAISRSLASGGNHVEPFEDLSEIADHWPRFGHVLVHDEGDAIAELMTLMVRAGRWLPVIAFAPAPAIARVVEAILHGAIDYLAWPFDEATFAATLDRAQTRVHGIGAIRLREAVARNRIERLTGREREVLAGVVDGHSSRAIAERLAISPRTVEIHRASLLQKMGAGHTSEAIRVAIEASLTGARPA